MSCGMRGMLSSSPAFHCPSPRGDEPEIGEFNCDGFVGAFQAFHVIEESGVFVACEHATRVSEGCHCFGREAVESFVGFSFVFEPEARAGLDLGGLAFAETMNKLPADVRM